MKLNDIKPKESGISDKFSWNLYAYIKKYGFPQKILWDSSDGRSLHPMNIYVLNRNTGVKLRSLMENHKTRYDFSSYPLETYTDITEEFWKTYVLKGRCMFDKEHNGWWYGGDQRFTIINRNSKRCRWCGAILRRNIVTTRTEKWEVNNGASEE